MGMEGRYLSVLNKYKFGFNGKECNYEVENNQYDYGKRIYNSRVGRFLSVDPLFQSYPYYSLYQFAGDKPIKYIDLDGEEEYDPNDDPMFATRLLATTFYDIKHSVENLILRLAPTPPGTHLQADYKLDKNGNQIFETEWRIVPNGSFTKEALSVGCDAANLAIAGKGKLNPTELLFSKTASENQLVRAFKGVLKDAEDFYKSASKLAIGERIAKFKDIAKQTAAENKWSRNSLLEKKNPGRTIYTDENGLNYSLDTQHGRFEVVDIKGKHQGEIDFSGKQTKTADLTGQHDLNVK